MLIKMMMFLTMMMIMTMMTLRYSGGDDDDDDGDYAEYQHDDDSNGKFECFQVRVLRGYGCSQRVDDRINADANSLGLNPRAWLTLGNSHRALYLYSPL